MRRLDSWNWDVAPEFVTCSTGGGKFASDAAIRICTYMGSQLWVSVKPELADFGLGRCVDTSIGFRSELRNAKIDPGVDPTGITSVRYQKPRFRSFLLDPHWQSVYGSLGLGSKYTALNDIPDDDVDTAIARTKVLCRALVDSKENSNADRFFENAPMATIYSAIGHSKTRFPQELQTLPAVADFLMGKDPKTGAACPIQFRKNLESMRRNPEWGGTISSAASRLLQAGEKTFGSVIYEISNNIDFVQTPAMRRHLSGPSNFSYEDIGNDQFPIALFIIPSRDDLEGARRFMRLHVAMFIAVMKKKTTRPSLPILASFDEARQYIGPEAAEAALVLRDNRVKQVQYWQTPSSAKATLGDGPFNEYVAQSTVRGYGVRDIDDAEWFSRILGQRSNVNGESYPLADPQTVLRELAISSNLQYVIPYAGPPVQRLHRRGFKTIRTREGLYLPGLPLHGHYDDGLSRYSN